MHLSGSDEAFSITPADVLSAKEALRQVVGSIEDALDKIESENRILLGGWEGDKILRNADNNPNRKGALLAAGKDVPGLASLLPLLASGQVEGVLALGSLCAEDATALGALRGVRTVALASNAGPLADVASVIVPVATHAEAEGSFINAKGMSQRFWAAIPAPQGVRPAWDVITTLAKLLGKDAGFANIADLRRALPAGTTAQEARV